VKRFLLANLDCINNTVSGWAGGGGGGRENFHVKEEKIKTQFFV